MIAVEEDAFRRERRAVLSEHPAGAELDDIRAAVDRHRARPAQNFAHALSAAASAGATLLQPGVRATTVEAQKRLLARLRDEGRAELLTMTVDGGLEPELGNGRQAAGPPGPSGLQALRLGVGPCREVVWAARRPVQARHDDPDARLLAEVTLAAGCTAFEGGAITGCLPSPQGGAVGESIRRWRYVDRLCALYEAHGVAIEREPSAVSPGVPVPPAVAVACALIDLMLALREGVRCFSLAIAPGGEVVQDVAAVAALKRLGDRVVRIQAGGVRTRVTTALHQCADPFPGDRREAGARFALGAFTAVLARPTRVVTQPRREAQGTSDAAASVAGLLSTRLILQKLRRVDCLDRCAVEEERAWIEREALAIVSRILELSRGGDLTVGIARACERGHLDLPLASGNGARGAVWPTRDASGAIRYGDPGALPFDAETLAHNRRCLRGRRAGPQTRLAEMLELTEKLPWG